MDMNTNRNVVGITDTPIDQVVVMNEAGYAFSFKGFDTHCADDYQKDAMLYSFESEK